jgi:co-chaperonin GroES (HSP10)
MNNIKPHGKRLLLSFIGTEQETTESGIFIPTTSDNKKGQGKVEKLGNDLEYPFNIGDTVYYNQHAGVVLEDCLLIDEKDILAVVE